jgi:hypothetical protein
LKLWQQKNETNMQVVERATHLLEDWRSAQIIRGGRGALVSRNQPDLSSQEIIPWEKPAIGCYKCNIDASFSSSMNKVVIGMCVRDDAGDFVLAKTLWLSPLCDIDLGETVGLHTTLEFALDAKKIVDAVRTSVEDSSEFGCFYRCM